MLIRYALSLTLLAVLLLALPTASQAQSLYVPSDSFAVGFSGGYVIYPDASDGVDAPVASVGASITGRIDIGASFSQARLSDDRDNVTVTAVNPFVSFFLSKQGRTNSPASYPNADIASHSVQLSVGYLRSRLERSGRYGSEEQTQEGFTLGLAGSHDFHSDPYKHTVFTLGVSTVLEQSLQTDLKGRLAFGIGTSIVIR